MAAATDSVLRTHFAFEIDGAPPLHVLRIDGAEGLSELFRFEVTLTTEEVSSSLSKIVGRTATLTMSGVGAPRVIHGIVGRFRQGASGKRYGVYHATLVPKIFPLEHRIDARIFQEMTTPEIVEAVFGEAGMAPADWRLALEQEYAPREYCVQYRESDWAFVSRLLEEEGMFYFFEAIEGATRLVIADGASVHEEIAAPSALAFRPSSGALIGDEAVVRLEAVEQMHAGKVTLRDYNFKNPGLSLEANAAAARHADLEAFDYPGGYGVPAAGERIAKIRSEEKCASGLVIEGETNCTRFAPGLAYTLQDHPFSDLNVEYVIGSQQIEGAQSFLRDELYQGPTYAARFTALPRSLPFRAPRLTPKPTIHVQTAIVVGPEGDEIHTDEHGRVKVQFHWDRRGERNDRSSTWIRVSNAWAGTGFGAMFLPRVGHEVVVDFLDGDPDRPIVVGRVYHGTNVPPHGLPANKTKSTIKSLSSPDGEEGNELSFEDKKDEEQVYLHAKKDLVTAVENDRTQTVGNDDSLEVTANRTVTVGADESADVTGNRTATVGGDESLTVEGDATFTMNKKLTVAVTEDAEVEYAQNYSLTVGQDAEESVTGKKTIEVQGEKFELTCGQSKIKVSQSGVEIEALEVKVKGMTSATLEGQAQVEVKASGQVTVKGEGMVTVQASGMVQVKGAMVKVN
jgi:type VI secretion system secreted protein VgrG